MRETDEPARSCEVREQPPPPLRDGDGILLGDIGETRVGELELVHRALPLNA